PIGVDVGALAGSLGNTVTNAGGLVNPNGPNGAQPIPGLITSLVGSTNLGVINGAPSTNNPLGPLQSTLASLGFGGNPLGSLSTLTSGTPLAGLSSGLSSTPLSSPTSALSSTGGAAGPLASLTGQLSGVTNGMTSGVASTAASGGAGGGAQTLAPVTALLGQLTGTLSSAAGPTASIGSIGSIGSTGSASNPASGLTTVLGGIAPASLK
ncbi:MAG TPA: hypothetical protein VF573_19465, partial [Paraburkholderia sp.]